MRRAIVFCFVSSAVLCGCTNTVELWGESPEAVSRHIREVQGKSVDLALTDGATHKDVTVNFFGDSVGFQKEDSVTATVVPISSVVSVLRAGSAWGPVLGFLGGMVLGGSIGMATGASHEPEANNSSGQLDIAMNTSFAVASNGLIGACIGGAVGVVAGAVIGGGTEYILDPGPFAGARFSRSKRCVVFERNAAGDTVILGITQLIEETPTKITIRWRGKEMFVRIPPAEILRKDGTIRMVVPEGLLR